VITFRVHVNREGQPYWKGSDHSVSTAVRLSANRLPLGSTAAVGESGVYTVVADGHGRHIWTDTDGRYRDDILYVPAYQRNPGTVITVVEGDVARDDTAQAPTLTLATPVEE